MSNLLLSPLALRLIRYFTAHAASGFEALSFQALYWNDRPAEKTAAHFPSGSWRLAREKSDNWQKSTKRSGVRMIATRARSKAKALLPSGWFR
jgi:hypothetical protein